MNICNCALPAIRGNSDCCVGCPNNDTKEFIWGIYPIKPQSPITKKIIEKFDDKGKLISRITMEIRHD